RVEDVHVGEVPERQHAAAGGGAPRRGGAAEVPPQQVRLARRGDHGAVPAPARGSEHVRPVESGPGDGAAQRGGGGGGSRGERGQSGGGEAGAQGGALEDAAAAVLTSHNRESDHILQRDINGKNVTTCAPPRRPRCQPLRWPSPVTTYLVDVSSGSPIGPRAWSFCVEMPISAPNPNSSPSVKRVEAFTITAAESTSATKRFAAGWDVVTIASVWPEPCRRMCATASSRESTTRAAMSRDRYSAFQSSSVASTTSSP